MRARDSLSDLEIVRVYNDAVGAGLDRAAALRAVIERAVARVSRIRHRDPSDTGEFDPVIDLITREVASRCLVSYDRLKGRDITKRYAYARRLAWYVAHDRFAVSQVDLGFAFGRDRSVVSLLLARWADKLAADPKANDVERAVMSKLGKAAA